VRLRAESVRRRAQAGHGRSPATRPRGPGDRRARPPVPQGERGEVVIRSANVMRGYLNRPQETAKTSVDGWPHTGEVGVYDEDDYLRIVDRIKDMIIRGGENIYPKESRPRSSPTRRARGGGRRPARRRPRRSRPRLCPARPRLGAPCAVRRASCQVQAPSGDRAARRAPQEPHRQDRRARSGPRRAVRRASQRACSEDSDDGLDRLSSEELHDVAHCLRAQAPRRPVARAADGDPAGGRGRGRRGPQYGGRRDGDRRASTTSPTPAGPRPPRCCGRSTSTTSGATGRPRRERAPGSVVITQNA
jgi:hypothetical protein